MEKIETAEIDDTLCLRCGAYCDLRCECTEECTLQESSDGDRDRLMRRIRALRGM